MAPTTLVLALRKQRREAKRLHRSEDRRSTMRATTLRTEAQTEERERYEKDNPNRKGRRAQHETGEVRVVRKMTQDELIAAALEEEERNKEDLRAWVRREEERRELRRVGRKRVRGSRWTWISRTVGKMVGVVGEGDGQGDDVGIVRSPERPNALTPAEASALNVPAQSAITAAADLPDERTTLLSSSKESPVTVVRRDSTPSAPTATQLIANTPSNTVPPPMASTSILPFASEAPVAPAAPAPLPIPASEAVKPCADDTSSQYTRNYLILSQIPGGLPAELAIVLGEHVKWDEVQFIPTRNRPISEPVSQSFHPH